MPLAVTEDDIRAIRLTVSGKVRALLARHGVADSRQQIALLMTLMEASHSQVYRKLSGRSSWLEEDLQRVALHHGETLGTLFRDDADDDPTHATVALVWHPVKVNLGGRWVEGLATLAEDCKDGPGADDRPYEGLALIDTPEGKLADWFSSEVPRPPGHVLRGRIGAMRIDHIGQAHGGFAVFDDDPDVADAIADNLLARGMEAQAFYATQDLRASRRRFDNYIIDWFSSDTTTAGDLIEHLRTRHAPDATIVVLTGQIQRGGAESQLAQLIHTHDVMVELKPMRVDLLLAKIARQRQQQA